MRTCGCAGIIGGWRADAGDVAVGGGGSRVGHGATFASNECIGGAQPVRGSLRVVLWRYEVGGC